MKDFWYRICCLAAVALCAAGSVAAIGITQNLKVHVNTGEILRPEVVAFVRTNAIATTTRSNTWTAAQTFGSGGSAVGKIVFGRTAITNLTMVVSNSTLLPGSIAVAQWAAEPSLPVSNLLYCTCTTGAVAITSIGATGAVNYLAFTP